MKLNCPLCNALLFNSNDGFFECSKNSNLEERAFYTECRYGFVDDKEVYQLVMYLQNNMIALIGLEVANLTSVCAEENSVYSHSQFGKTIFSTNFVPFNKLKDLISNLDVLLIFS